MSTEHHRRKEDVIIESMTAGIDWYSASYQYEGLKAMQVTRAGQDYLGHMAKNGYELKARSLYGYDGHMAGGCFVGLLDRRIYMQFTGAHANDVFESVYMREAHQSRIDMQVSVKYVEMPLTIAKEAYHDASIENDLLPITRRRKLTMYTGSDGGDTFYCGSMSSSQFGRLYNKEVQSGLDIFARTWRYEVVFRDELAVQWANSLFSNLNAKEQYIAAAVYDWWRKRGVVPLFDRRNAIVIEPLLELRQTDARRKLEWIRTQVMPSIRYLREAGYGDTLDAILSGEKLDLGGPKI